MTHKFFHTSPLPWPAGDIGHFHLGEGGSGGILRGKKEKGGNGEEQGRYCEDNGEMESKRVKYMQKGGEKKGYENVHACISQEGRKYHF